MLSRSFRRLLCPPRRLVVAARPFGDKPLPFNGASGNQEARPFMEGNPWRTISAVTFVLGSLATMMLGYNPGKEAVKDTKAVAIKLLGPLALVPLRLEDCTVESKIADTKFVKRPAIEEVIREAVYSSKPTFYHIVYGAKGVGKSSLVERVAAGRKGVVQIYVGSADKIETITADFMEKVTGQAVTFKIEPLRAALIEYTENMKTKAQVKAMNTGDGGSQVEGDFIPTIIFDVDRGEEGSSNHKDVLQQVRSLAKGIYDVCNCIVIVSEANAVFEFGYDDRENFIYVDEMTFEETNEFLIGQMAYITGKNTIRAPLTDEDHKKIYNNVGGNPVLLMSLLEKMKTKSLDSCIEHILVSACADLAAFKLKPILKALKEHPEGVEAIYFDGQEYGGIYLSNPKEVGNAMKSRNAVVYRKDLETAVYQMQSIKYKNALRRYEPYGPKP
jgi:AAA+ ATPase superfamily predicted ATPase